MPSEAEVADLYATLLAEGDADLVQVQDAFDVIAIFRAATELVLGEQLITAPTLRVPAAVAAAEGGVCVVRGGSYRIRQVRKLPPDGRERLLVLTEG